MLRRGLRAGGAEAQGLDLAHRASTEGGGCLYDYAAHPINLVNWLFGRPEQVSGTVLNSIFSGRGSTTRSIPPSAIADGPSVQLSVNWSDESYRKMSTRITL